MSAETKRARRIMDALGLIMSKEGVENLGDDELKDLSSAKLSEQLGEEVRKEAAKRAVRALKKEGSHPEI